MSTSPSPPPAPGSSAGDDSVKRKVFVTNVSDKIGEGNLKEFFNYCGKVTRIQKQWDKAAKQFGYEIEFEKVKGAAVAAGLNGTDLAGQAIVVQSVHENPVPPDGMPPVPPSMAPDPSVPALLPPPGMMPMTAANPFGVSAAATAGQPFLAAQASQYAAVAALAPVSAGGIPDAKAMKIAEERMMRTYDDRARTVHVSGFDKTMTEANLVKFFSACGPISHIRIGEQTGSMYAFIEFMSQDGTENALRLNGAEIVPGQPLRLNRSNNAIVKAPPQTHESQNSSLHRLLSRINEKSGGMKTSRRRSSSSDSGRRRRRRRSSSPRRSRRDDDRRREAERRRSDHKRREEEKRENRSRYRDLASDGEEEERRSRRKRSEDRDSSRERRKKGGDDKESDEGKKRRRSASSEEDRKGRGGRREEKGREKGRDEEESEELAIAEGPRLPGEPRRVQNNGKGTASEDEKSEELQPKKRAASADSSESFHKSKKPRSSDGGRRRSRDRRDRRDRSRDRSCDRSRGRRGGDPYRDMDAGRRRRSSRSESAERTRKDSPEKSKKEKKEKKDPKEAALEKLRKLSSTGTARQPIEL